MSSGPTAYCLYQKWDVLIARVFPCPDLMNEGYTEIPVIRQELAVIIKINQDALNNSNRKLAEANARIVEFEDIKKGHLQTLKEMQNRLDQMLILINNDVNPNPEI